MKSWLNTENFKYFASTGHSGFPAPSKWVGVCRSWIPECHSVCRHYSAQGGLLILFFLQSLRKWRQNATLLMTLPGYFLYSLQLHTDILKESSRRSHNIVPFLANRTTLFNGANWCMPPNQNEVTVQSAFLSITERPIQKSVKRSVRASPPPSTKPQRIDFQVESSRSRLHVRTEGGLSFTISSSLNGKKFHAQIHKGKSYFRHQRF